MTDMTETALGHRAKGLSVIPVAADDWTYLAKDKDGNDVSVALKKRPAVMNGQGPKPFGWDAFKMRSMSEQEIERHFKNAPKIGIVCGQVSGHLEVIDHDAPGMFESWCAIVRAFGYEDLLNRLVITQTPRGHGYHCIYRCPEGIEPGKKLARRSATPEELAVKPKELVKGLIETRGEGHYIVAFPSSGYTLYRGDLGSIPVITAAERKVLIDAAKSLDQLLTEEEAKHATTKRESNTDTLQPGSDFNARAEWSNLLEPHGWQEAYRHGHKVYWVRPGKERRDGIGATSGLGRNGQDLLHVFTTSAYPLEGETTYSKFEAFTILECQGDRSRAARELAKRGFGTPLTTVAKTSPREIESADETPKRRFRILKPSEIQALPPRAMLIEGLIGVEDRWMLFGRPGSGKSFCVIDFLICCSVGGTWAGSFDCARPLKVLYCAAEGKHGLGARISSCLTQYEISWYDIEDNFRMVSDVPQIIDGDSEESIFVLLEEAFQDGYSPDIIVLDTLHKASDGAEESSNDDARRACKVLKKVGERYGCSVGLVHHSGHGSDHPRGASGYLGDMDVVMRLDLDDEIKAGALVLYKGKDIKPWPKIPISIVPVDDSAVIEFRPGFDDKADGLVGKIILAMLQKPNRTWWTPTDLANAIPGMSDNAHAIRMSCFRDSKKGEESLIEWDGETRPAHYKRRNG